MQTLFFIQSENHTVENKATLLFELFAISGIFRPFSYYRPRWFQQSLSPEQYNRVMFCYFDILPTKWNRIKYLYSIYYIILKLLLLFIYNDHGIRIMYNTRKFVRSRHVSSPIFNRYRGYCDSDHTQIHSIPFHSHLFHTTWQRTFILWPYLCTWPNTKLSPSRRALRILSSPLNSYKLNI